MISKVDFEVTIPYKKFEKYLTLETEYDKLCSDLRSCCNMSQVKINVSLPVQIDSLKLREILKTVGMDLGDSKIVLVEGW